MKVLPPVLVSIAMLSAAGSAVSVGSRHAPKVAGGQFTVAVGLHPIAIAIDKKVAHAFILDRGRLNHIGNPVGVGSVTMLDTRTGRVLRTTRVNVDPNAIDVDPRTSRVFVVNGGPFDASGMQVSPGVLTMLDASSGQMLRSLTVGASPGAVMVDAPDRRVLVINRGSNGSRGSVSFVDALTGKLLRTTTTGIYPAAVALDHFRHRAFVANFVSNTVIALDTRSGRVVRTTRLGPSPGTVASLAMDNHVHRLFALSFPPRAVAATSLAGHLSVVSSQTGRLVKTVSLLNPLAMAVDAQQGTIIISNTVRGHGHLTSLTASNEALRWKTPVGPAPGVLSLDRQSRDVLVVDQTVHKVAVIDTQSGRRRCSVMVGKHPTAIAVDNATHHAFVVDEGDNHVSILQLGC